MSKSRAQARQAFSQAMAAIMDKLKRLATKWPVVVVVLGVLLTVVWTGVLIWIVFDLLMLTSRF